MASWDDSLDLGATDYLDEDESGLSKFLAKPIQRAYQPFNPAPTQEPFSDNSLYAPESAPPTIGEPQYSAMDQLDEYDEAKKYYSTLSNYSAGHGRQAALWKKRQDDFLETKLKPFGERFGIEYKDGTDLDAYEKAIEDAYKRNTSTANQKDGWSGASSEKEQAQLLSKDFAPWDGANGLRSQLHKHRDEYRSRQDVADQFKREQLHMEDRLLSIPMEQRMALDAARRAPKGRKLRPEEMDSMLNSYKWETPAISRDTGAVMNIDKIDPRWRSESVSRDTGASVTAATDSRQASRLEAASRGDLKGFLQNRDSTERTRSLWDRGFLSSDPTSNHPRSLSREDEDILDIDKMRAAGLTEYKGQPIDGMFESLGGEEKLRMAKFLRSVYENKAVFEEAQLAFLKTAGGGKGRDEATEKMEAAREMYHKSLATAGEMGLTGKVFEQAHSPEERVGMITGLFNAFKRGMKVSDMAELSDDMITNSLDESEMQKLIQLSQEIEDLPGSTAMQRLHKAPSKDAWEAIGKILGNPKAIPEMIVESMASFLPTYLHTAPAVIGGAAATGLGNKMRKGGKKGMLAFGLYGAKLNWGVSSFVVEYAGSLLEEMGELGVDWRNPKIFAAAWNNPIIRDKLKAKAAKKAGGVALLDTVSALMAGNVGAAFKYNKIRGGKLIDGKAWAKAKKSVPRFTKFQRLRGAAGELGFGAGTGMSGEMLGQYWSNDPGQPFNWDAIAAEGVVEVAGPGGIGAMMSVLGNNSKQDLSGSAMEWSDPKATAVGQTGTITRAGMENNWNSFDNSDSASAHLLEASKLAFDSEGGRWTQDYMARLQNASPEKFQNIRWILADRTPGGVEQEGSFEYDSETGSYAIYLNQELMKKSPLRAFMHESGHFARHLIFENDAELKTIYDSLGPDAQKDALAEYVLKSTGIKYNSLAGEQKAAVDKVWDSTNETIRREEWFAFQWARILAGETAHKTVAGPLKQFLKAHIVPAFEGFMGSEEYNGSAEQTIKIQESVLDAMGWARNGTRMGDPVDFFEYKSQHRAPAGTLPEDYSGLTDQEGLNNLIEAIKAMDEEDRVKAIHSVNAIMGSKFLDPNDSAFASRKEKEALAEVVEERAKEIRAEVNKEAEARDNWDVATMTEEEKEELATAGASDIEARILHSLEKGYTPGQASPLAEHGGNIPGSERVEDTVPRGEVKSEYEGTSRKQGEAIAARPKLEAEAKRLKDEAIQRRRDLLKDFEKQKLTQKAARREWIEKEVATRLEFGETETLYADEGKVKRPIEKLKKPGASEAMASIARINRLEGLAGKPVHKILKKGGGVVVTTTEPGSKQRPGLKKKKRFKTKEEAEKYIAKKKTDRTTQEDKTIDALENLEGLVRKSQKQLITAVDKAREAIANEILANDPELKKNGHPEIRAAVDRMVKEGKLKPENAEEKITEKTLHRLKSEVSTSEVLAHMVGTETLLRDTQLGRLVAGRSLAETKSAIMPSDTDVDEAYSRSEGELEEVRDALALRKDELTKELMAEEAKIKSLQKVVPGKKSKKKQDWKSTGGWQVVFGKKKVNYGTEKFNKEFAVGLNSIESKFGDTVRAAKREEQVKKQLKAAVAKAKTANAKQKKGKWEVVAKAGKTKGSLSVSIAIKRGASESSTKVSERDKKLSDLAEKQILTAFKSYIKKYAKGKYPDAENAQKALTEELSISRDRLSRLVGEETQKGLMPFNFINPFFKAIAATTDMTATDMLEILETGRVESVDPSSFTGSATEKDEQFKRAKAARDALKAILDRPKDKNDKPVGTSPLYSLFKEWRPTVESIRKEDAIKALYKEDPKAADEAVLQRLMDIMNLPEGMRKMGKYGKEEGADESAEGQSINQRRELVQNRIKLVNRLEMLMAPAEHRIMWEDIPVSVGFFNGYLQKQTDRETGAVTYRPVTLGDLASRSDSFDIFKKVKGKEVSQTVNDPQEFLRKLAVGDEIQRFDASKVKNKDKVAAEYGNMSPFEFEIRLKAAWASRMLPSGQGAQTVYTHNWPGPTGDRKQNISYTPSQGTPLLQLFADLVMDAEQANKTNQYRKHKAEGTLYKTDEKGKQVPHEFATYPAITSVDPTNEEALLYEVIQGEAGAALAGEASRAFRTQQRQRWIKRMRIRFLAQEMKDGLDLSSTSLNKKQRKEAQDKHRIQISDLIEKLLRKADGEEGPGGVTKDGKVSGGYGTTNTQTIQPTEAQPRLAGGAKQGTAAFSEWSHDHLQREAVETLLGFWQEELDEGGIPGGMSAINKAFNSTSTKTFLFDKDKDLAKRIYDNYKLDAKAKAKATDDDTKILSFTEWFNKEKKKAKDDRKIYGDFGNFSKDVRGYLVDTWVTMEKEDLAANGLTWTKLDQHMADLLVEYYVEGNIHDSFLVGRYQSTDKKGFKKAARRARVFINSTEFVPTDKANEDYLPVSEKPYIQHEEAFQNPDVDVEKYDGDDKHASHGKFKRGIVDKAYDLLRLYGKTVGLVIRDEDGTIIGEGKSPQPRNERGTSWKAWEKEQLETTEAMLEGFYRDYMEDGDTVAFTNAKGEKTTATWDSGADGWVNEEGEKYHRPPDVRHKGFSEPNTELDYYRITDAWANKEANLGYKTFQSLHSTAHITPRRLAEYFLERGPKFFDMASRDRKTGFVAKGSPFTGMLPRIFFPLVEQMYKDLNIDGSVLEDFRKKFDPNYNAETAETEAETVETEETEALGPPSELILNGAGLSKEIHEIATGLDIQVGGTSRHHDNDADVLEGLTNSPKATKIGNKGSQAIYENEHQPANIAAADYVVIFRAKQKRAPEKWYANGSLDNAETGLKALLLEAPGEKEGIKGLGHVEVDIDNVADVRKVYNAIKQLKEEVTDPKVWFHTDSLNSSDFTDERKANLNHIFAAILDGKMPKLKAKEKAKEEKAKSDAAKTETVEIHFKNDKNKILSNFHLLSKGGTIEHEGYEFRSVEHAYQAFKNQEKSQDEEYVKSIQDAETGDDARKLGQGIQPDTKKDYNTNLMEELLQKRADADSAFKRALKKTGDKTLTHGVGSKFWKDKFPEMLMNLRDNKIGMIGRDKEDYLYMTGSMDSKQAVAEALQPIMQAVASAGRLDVFKEQAEFEAHQRNFMEDDYSSADDVRTTKGGTSSRTDDDAADMRDDSGDYDEQSEAEKAGGTGGTTGPATEDLVNETTSSRAAIQASPEQREKAENDFSKVAETVKGMVTNRQFGAIPPIKRDGHNPKFWLMMSYAMDDYMGTYWEDMGFPERLPSPELFRETNPNVRGPRTIFKAEVARWALDMKKSDQFRPIIEIIEEMFGRKPKQTFEAYFKQLDNLYGDSEDFFALGSSIAIPKKARLFLHRVLYGKTSDVEMPSDEGQGSEAGNYLGSRLATRANDADLGYGRDPYMEGAVRLAELLGDGRKHNAKVVLEHAIVGHEGSELTDYQKVLKAVLNDKNSKELENIDVHISKDMGTDSGRYSLASNDIKLSVENGGVMEDIFLHELIHGLTSRKLKVLTGGIQEKALTHAIKSGGGVQSLEDRIENTIYTRELSALAENQSAHPAVRELADALILARKHHSGRDGALYGLSNLDEFLAEAFSNPKFQTVLAGIEAGKQETLWQVFVDAVKGLLGLDVEGTLLGEVLNLGAEILHMDPVDYTSSKPEDYGYTRSRKKLEKGQPSKEGVYLGSSYMPHTQLGMPEIFRTYFLPNLGTGKKSPQQWASAIKDVTGLESFAEDTSLLPWLRFHHKAKTKSLSDKDILKYLDKAAPRLDIYWKAPGDVKEHTLEHNHFKGLGLKRKGLEKMKNKDIPSGSKSPMPKSMRYRDIAAFADPRERGEMYRRNHRASKGGPQALIAHRLARTGDEMPFDLTRPGIPHPQRRGHDEWADAEDTVFFLSFQESKDVIRVMELQSDWLQKLREVKSEAREKSLKFAEVENQDALEQGGGEALLITKEKWAKKAEDRVMFLADNPPLEKIWIDAAVRSMIRFARNKGKTTVAFAYQKPKSERERWNDLKEQGHDPETPAFEALLKKIPISERMYSELIPRALKKVAKELGIKPPRLHKRKHIHADATVTYEDPEGGPAAGPVLAEWKNLPQEVSDSVVRLKAEMEGFQTWPDWEQHLTDTVELGRAPNPAVLKLAARNFMGEIVSERGEWSELGEWDFLEMFEDTVDRQGNPFIEDGVFDNSEVAHRFVELLVEDYMSKIEVTRKGELADKEIVLDIGTVPQDTIERLSLYGVIPESMYDAKHEAAELDESRIFPEDESQYLGSSVSAEQNLSKISQFFSKFNKTEAEDAWGHMKEKWDQTKTGSGAVRSLQLDYVDADAPIRESFNRMLEAAGIDRRSAVADAMNTYEKKHIYFGEGYHDVEQLRVLFKEPFMQAIIDSGVDPADVGAYLQARMAPARNIHHKHQYRDMLAETKDPKKKEELLAKGEPTSGISTEAAIDIVKGLEQEPAMQKFLNHKNNPLQLFYDMGIEDLDTRASSNLIDNSERSRMISAASYHDWRGISKHMPKFKKGVDSRYSYAPMQGFEDETQSFFDKDEAWTILGNPSGSTGKGFDQPKGLLTKGAFGRYQKKGEEYVGPDPAMAYAAAERQRTEGLIRAQKNGVVNSFANFHDVMRSIAYGEEDNAETRYVSEFEGLNIEELHKNEEVRKAMKKEYDSIFKTYVRQVDKNEYAWQDEELSVEGTNKRMRVIRKTISNDFKNDPKILVFRRDGVAHYIEFQETPAGLEVAASMKNMRYEALPELLKMFNKGTRFLSTMVTSRNPSFVIPNFVKDWGTAYVNLGQDEDSKKFRGKALAPGRISKFGKAIWTAETKLNKDNQNPFDVKTLTGSKQEQAKQLLAENDPVKMYMFAKSSGALVGYFRHNSIVEILEDMQKNTDPRKQGSVSKNWKKFVAVADALNSVAENSVRISSFWAAIEHGFTVQQAATLSRNSTVDFNQGGNFSQHMNALYMFFRASVNATDRAWSMLKARGWKNSTVLATKIIGASYAIAVVNRLLDDDEEETEPQYDQRSTYSRDRNMTLGIPQFISDSTGVGEKGDALTIPLPLGVPVALWSVGQVLADWTAHYGFGRGGTGMLPGTMRLSGSVMDSVNPLGSGSLGAMLTPAILTPFTEIAANEDFMGRDIVYENLGFGDKEPAHMRDPKRTPKFWTDISKGINELAGGSDQTFGSFQGLLGDDPLNYSEDQDVKWDISGNQMRHVIRSILGGVYDFGEDGVMTALDIVGNDPDRFNDIPVLSRFYKGSTHGGKTRTKFYSLKDNVGQADAHLRAAEKSDNPTKYVREAKEQHKTILKYSESVSNLDKAKRKMSRATKKVENDPTMTDWEKTQRVANLEATWLSLAAKIINKAQADGIRL